MKEKLTAALSPSIFFNLVFESTLLRFMNRIGKCNMYAQHLTKDLGCFKKQLPTLKLLDKIQNSNLNKSDSTKRH